MALQEITVPHLTTYNFGIGVDRLTGSAMNLAVNPTPSAPRDAGGARQTLEVARVMSTQDLEEQLGIDASASYGCAAFGAGISARFGFARNSQVHAASLFMTVTSTIHFADESIDECVLTTAAQNHADRRDIFESRYGNMFARACRRGGLFVGLMRVETTDEREASSIEADLKGSYGLFSADASTRFASITEKHHATVYCRMYAEGGPALQLTDPTDPRQLLDAANRWLKAMFDDPAKYAQPYEWTLAPLSIAEGPMPLNAVDLEHAQDVLTFCAKERTQLLDQLNLLNWWLAHRDQYDWTPSDSPDIIANAARDTQTDLDTLAACASHAIDAPKDAPLPADFAQTKPVGRYRLSAPLPKGPTPIPGVAGVWQQTTEFQGQSYTSKWTLSPTGPGSFNAQETGLGSAIGAAILRGTHLEISWATSQEQGTYAWDMDPAFTRGQGGLTFTAGGRAGQTSTASRVVRIPAGASVGPAAAPPAIGPVNHVITTPIGVGAHVGHL